jgi:hypothetical protein
MKRALVMIAATGLCLVAPSTTRAEETPCDTPPYEGYLVVVDQYVDHSTTPPTTVFVYQLRCSE